MNAIDPARFYTQAELATLLNLGVKAITRECRRGTIRASQLTGRRFAIQGQAAIDFLRSRENRPTVTTRKKA